MALIAEVYSLPNLIFDRFTMAVVTIATLRF